MSQTLADEVRGRGITRICHFTPSRNLVHIATGKTGVLATSKLEEQERAEFTPTDLVRLDGYKDYISCSIEYPNAWYFDKVRAKDALFKDWVVLFIDPRYLLLPGTRFCPRNAASNFGRNVSKGVEGFIAMYEESVAGAYGKTFRRSANHLHCCPTDDQAEVLIPDQIHLKDILAVCVESETQVKDEIARLRLLGQPTANFKFLIAPLLFDKYALSGMIRSGKRPPEISWSAGGS